MYQAEGGAFTILAVADGLIFVDSTGNSVVAINAATGDERWTVDTGSDALGSPAVVDGVVYVGSVDHYGVCAG